MFYVIKLDGSITREITNNDRSRDIITSISSMAHNFNINILAEFVENEQQRKCLKMQEFHLQSGFRQAHKNELSSALLLIQP